MLSQKLGGLCSQHLLERRVLSMSHSPKVGSLCERAGVGHPKTKGIPGEVGGLQQRGINALARSPETIGRLGGEPQWCSQVQERHVPSEGASPKDLLKVPMRTSQSRESRHNQPSKNIHTRLLSPLHLAPTCSNQKPELTSWNRNRDREKRRQLAGPT